MNGSDDQGRDRRDDGWDYSEYIGATTAGASWYVPTQVGNDGRRRDRPRTDRSRGRKKKLDRKFEVNFVDILISVDCSLNLTERLILNWLVELMPDRTVVVSSIVQS